MPSSHRMYSVLVIILGFIIYGPLLIYFADTFDLSTHSLNGEYLATGFAAILILVQKNSKWSIRKLILTQISLIAIVFALILFRTNQINHYLTLIKTSYQNAEIYRESHFIEKSVSSLKKQNALHYAAGSGNLEAVQYYASSGVDSQAQDSSHKTPAQIAEERGYSEVSAFLNQSATK